ncbi:MAG: GNAT family N-acetyltransferase [Chloroflexota bacterium]|nr:MAG: GNAT family N-acetyltransferase [Chloroflexota bacterium]
MTNITIRRADIADAEAITRIFECPRVIWGTLQLPYPSVQAWRKRLEVNDELFRFVACVDGQVIGTLGLHLDPNRPRRKHAGGIGMAVRDDWQGKGVGTALMQAVVELADKWLNLTRLELEVYVDNEPAVHLYKKFGFEIEGRIKQHSYRDGEYVDTYYMARLRPQK